MVGLANGQRAVVGLGDPGSSIVIVDSEYPPQHMFAELIVAVGQVLHVHVDLGVGVHVEDPLRSASGHCRHVP